MNDLYREVTQETENDASLVRVFSAGFQEFSKLKEVGNQNQDAVMDGTQRAMQIAESDMIDQLEQPLTLLSTIGSMSPYVGLFGTVWGIMTAFQALGTMQQASIAAVAPGISEALITTALGLFAAIPASIAYNRFTQQVTRLQNRTDMFSAELTNILQRASGK
ncbi:MAG: TolQ protein [uncultured bacterium]|nr:MAG: TolQ protein [uncultured bacterium]